MVFKFKKLSLHFQCLSATLHQRGISQGQILNSFLKQLSKYTSLILQFYFHSTKMTLPFNSKQSKWLNKYFKRYFLEIQVMKNTHLQEKGEGLCRYQNYGGKGSHSTLNIIYTCKWQTGGPPPLEKHWLVSDKDS